MTAGIRGHDSTPQEAVLSFVDGGRDRAGVDQDPADRPGFVQFRAGGEAVAAVAAEQSVSVRLARPEDAELVLRLRRESTEWLRSRGHDQWSSDDTLPWDKFEARVLAAIDAGTTFTAELDGEPVGTITVDTVVDPGLWTGEELHDCLVVHRMMVDRRHAGKGIGDALLTRADQQAAELGRSLLRLDAWTTNTRLHDYWRSKGFTLTRVVETDFPSAALFERPVRSTAD